ncbi:MULTISPECIES: LysR family transcriptional regulator [Micrococcaceae]|mgnify:CR=1 FL=1|uniref:LysR family transcriptional regulator n=1 Tax=Micrococcaceae TaxID=1268 RepID=UPI001619A9F1|nr:LysR family transcriptional regulator [Citricoccus sp.]MBB5750022.1 DNA-binding transcriptional LysR family regulator [Micrococcus sp. TA1]HRO30717.1 LysR family transcriptional regulator [Citricoccus sp.]HRO94368.1 LysR family transcriptional regulator [Citricoccus sp.]
MDLNLLRVFVAVYETGSLTTAARRLFVTQPAVSQALGRLRRELDDPLFERDGRTMRPTPVASTVFPAFREALSGVDRALDEIHGFDPALTDRRFRIAMSELGEIGWAPSILRAVRARAPRVGVDVVAMDVQALPEWLSRGTVDLAVTPSPVPGGFDHVALKSQSYGVAMSADHPLAMAPVSLADYVSAEHVAVGSDSGLPNLAAALGRLGAVITPQVTVNHFTSLPSLLAGDRGLIATVPDTIAAGWATTWPIVVQPLPFEMPAVDVRLYRRATTQQTAALDWIFTTVARAIQGSTGQFFAIHGDPIVGRPHHRA